MFNFVRVLLFVFIQEANKMVQDANIKRMTAEKLLKEARTKVKLNLQIY